VTGQERFREIVRGPHHCVGVGLRAGLDDRGLPVARERQPWLWRDDGADPAVALQQGRGLCQYALRLWVGGDLPLRVVDNHLQCRRVQPGELLAQDVAGPYRLAAAVLPAGTGQSGLDLGGKGTEDPEDQRPDDEDCPEVSAGPDAEAGEPPLRVRRGCIGLDGGGDSRHAERLLQVKGSARFSAILNLGNDTMGGILPALPRWLWMRSACPPIQRRATAKGPDVQWASGQAKDRNSFSSSAMSSSSLPSSMHCRRITPRSDPPRGAAGSHRREVSALPGLR
jgi:hypothetical protein